MEPLILSVLVCEKEKGSEPQAFFQHVPTQLSALLLFQTAEVLFSLQKAIYSMMFPRFWHEHFSCSAFCF